jgi:hypothetical protein
MIGLAGRRVPIALAVVPASVVSALLMVGGIGIWSSYAQMADAVVARGQDMMIVVSPAALWRHWVTTIGGAASLCGRQQRDHEQLKKRKP